MLFACLTTVFSPTPSVHAWARRVPDSFAGLVVAGDRKGPEGGVNLPGAVFLSLEQQVAGPFSLGAELPEGHYSRKNIAYLEAIRRGATCIFETDDDNAPLESWSVREESLRRCRILEPSVEGWVNVYRFFSDDSLIWPRGFPLERLRDPQPGLAPGRWDKQAPIQQGLVNGSPDVDAIWRLIQDRPFAFEDEDPLWLAPGQWCPFNTQSTWWWPQAFPLLYVPSFCSFRMCDIWKSFVAQRCLWALGLGIAFHPAEVFQDRNPHDYLRDFQEEVPGYLENARIARLLQTLELSSDPDAVAENLVICYRALVQEQLLPADELRLLEAWQDDLEALREGRYA